MEGGVHEVPQPLRAPFTSAQVEAMNAYQEAGMFHPFTCGNDSRHRNLVATEKGWICPDCDYTQNWAHPFMADTDVLELVNKYSRKGKVDS